MGIVTVDEVVSSKVAPSRLFKALVLDNHNLVPKIAPKFVKSGSIIQGDGGAGSIKQINFPDDGPFKFMKYQIDELDKEKFICKYTLLEGGELNETIKCIKYDGKIEANAEGGSINKLKREFHLVEGGKLSEEEIEAHKLRSNKLFQGVEAYLLENPDAYA